MKKLLLLFSLMAFVASPMVAVPDAEAAQHGKAKVTKAKKSKKSIRAKAKGKRHRHAGKHKIAAKPVMTPLRAVSYDKSWRDDDLNLRSAAALVVDQKTGEALYSKNIDVPTSIASITKLMTAMVTLDAELDLNEEIVIDSEDVDRLKGTGSRLALGTCLTREELLHLAAEIPIKPTVEEFPLEAANDVLIKIKHSQLKAAAVLSVNRR